MQVEKLRALLVDIGGLLEKAEVARFQMNLEIDNAFIEDRFEIPDSVLEQYLEEASVLLTFALDIAELRGALDSFLKTWRKFESIGLTEKRYLPEVDYLDSKPLNFLNAALRGLTTLYALPGETKEAYDLGRLEEVLEKTAVLVNGRSPVVSDEKTVRDVMHDYLGAYFSSYTKTPQINGSLKNYKPDSGVMNLQAAIEFKVAKTEAEVLVTLDGLFADVSGYAGSKDWTRFFAVVYQTKPFVSRDRYAAQFETARASGWHLILVNG